MIARIRKCEFYTEICALQAADGIYSHRTDEGDIILQDASKPDYEEVLLNATDVKEVGR